MKKQPLTILQRLFVSIVSIVSLSVVILFFSGNWEFLRGDSPYGIVFVSAALLLIFGTYITEPYFTKPVDTITNSVAILLALIAIEDKQNFIIYDYFFWITLATLALGLVTVVFSKDPKPEWQKKLFTFITTVGSSRWMFAIFYILTVISFFTERPAEFWALLTFLILILARTGFEDLVRIAYRIFKRQINHSQYQSLGEAIGRETPFLFKVKTQIQLNGLKTNERIVYLPHSHTTGYLGVIVKQKYLINDSWAFVHLLQEGGKVLKYDTKSQEISISSDIVLLDQSTFLAKITDFDQTTRRRIEENYLYKNTDHFIGFVSRGSNIQRIKFETIDTLSQRDVFLKEGSVVRTIINGEECLYQIVDAETNEENLESHDSSGFITGIAQKLGRYDTNENRFHTVKWLPEMYMPVLSLEEEDGFKPSELGIGVLPGTSMEIVLKDVNSLVTHNTAVLGILGSGKSVLTFDLIKKVVNTTNSKVIVLDITGEYLQELSKTSLSVDEIDYQSIDNAISPTYQKTNHQRAYGGNQSVFAKEIYDSLVAFFNSAQKVLIINPELFNVSKQVRDLSTVQFPSGWQLWSPISDLSIAEKTRIISEMSLELVRSKGKSNEAKCLLVYEEAHSLIPEWNSSANEGDSSATNGTARVILQGRKYGLGSIVVTQRTANISKSVLNQCNTIFALRVFDDTGKQFLENYVGSDYANTLPTLEDRHVVITGKALQLKQPIIMKVNEAKK